MRKVRTRLNNFDFCGDQTSKTNFAAIYYELDLKGGLEAAIFQILRKILKDELATTLKLNLKKVSNYLKFLADARLPKSPFKSKR